MVNNKNYKSPFEVCEIKFYKIIRSQFFGIVKSVKVPIYTSFSTTYLNRVVILLFP